jgi:Glycosyltransferase
MKLGLLINDLQNGGAERLVTDLALEFCQTDGIEPHILLAHRGGDLLSSLAPTEIQVHGLDVDISTTTIPQGAHALSEQLERLDIDLVHSHLSYSHVIGRFACARQGVPNVSTYHNVRAHKPRLKRLAERTTRSLSDCIVCVSEGVKQSYRNREGMVVIYNAIDTEGFRTRVESADTSALLSAHSNETTVFLNVARCVEQKRQGDLIQAFAEFDAPDTHLYIVGDGPRKQQLETLVSEQELSDRITITGYVDRIEPYYAIADAFVSSSSMEGLPSTHLEAKAAQLPIISTNIPGVTELVDHGTDGYLCAVEHPREIANYMRTVHTTDTGAMGRQGFESVDNEFSIGTIATEHADLYRRVV